MQFHRGRLLDHVHLRVKDLDASKSFYSAILAPLGLSLSGQSPHHFVIDELFFTAADGEPSRIHIAFQAEDEDAVRRFHEAALAAGGRDNGAPGPRSYHPGYFGAFVLDLDGNNVEAVYHGPSTRSAASVIVTPTGG